MWLRLGIESFRSPAFAWIAPVITKLPRMTVICCFHDMLEPLERPTALPSFQYLALFMMPKPLDCLPPEASLFQWFKLSWRSRSASNILIPSFEHFRALAIA